MNIGTDDQIDPICGMTVDPAKAAGKLAHDGKTFYFCGKGCLAKFQAKIESGEVDGYPSPEHLGAAATDTVNSKKAEEHIDPVCKMTVTAETAAGTSEMNGEKYYFCSNGCKTKFDTDPDKFLKPQKIEHQPEGVEYTCPMHPEIVQIGPGSCPICGMALEPKEITLDDAPDPEYVDMKRRFLDLGRR